MFNGVASNFYLQAASIAECTFVDPDVKVIKITLTLRYQEGKPDTGSRMEPVILDHTQEVATDNLNSWVWSNGIVNADFRRPNFGSAGSNSLVLR